MEGVMDTMLKDSTGNTFDAPAQPLVNFVVSEYVSIGNICGLTSNNVVPLPPFQTILTTHRTLKSCADSPTCNPPFYVLATYLGKSTMLEAYYVCFISSSLSSWFASMNCTVPT
ncbi:hypothetical protein FOQG_16510 [Fusarium oxysporum f. sp. raphani 54005]|uniref:Uncharacterized protein n=1 Tax=Fusarium oxysporum f. sp. raphani 54005 TaxID=1089458 RepID=X0BK56_FUSOX|nr:hypothetical protein FOQG_16510 [Fusarium oxysporum f. sp. raphani 54005]